MGRTKTWSVVGAAVCYLVIMSVNAGFFSWWFFAVFVIGAIAVAAEEPGRKPGRAGAPRRRMLRGLVHGASANFDDEMVRQLMDAVRAGDGGAQTLVYQWALKESFRLASHLDLVTADDERILATESAERFWLKVRDNPGEIRSPSAYLKAIVRNANARYWRGQARSRAKQTSSLDDERIATDIDGVSWDRLENDACFRLWLADQPLADQRIFRMKASGYNFEEIAKHMTAKFEDERWHRAKVSRRFKDLIRRWRETTEDGSASAAE